MRKEGEKRGQREKEKKKRRGRVEGAGGKSELKGIANSFGPDWTRSI